MPLGQKDGFEIALVSNALVEFKSVRFRATRAHVRMPVADV